MTREETTGDVKARHIPVRKEWLALRTEAPVDPGRPIIDAHHHLWDKPESRYLSDEALGDMSNGHRIVATIFVEGRAHWRTDGDPHLRPIGETEFVSAMATECDRRIGGRLQLAKGVVGYADLMLGEAAGDVVDQHVERSGGRFCGVRFSSAWHADPAARGSVLLPPPGLLYAPEVRRGLRELERRGLVFDAWMYHTQLGELADLAHDHDSLPIVLNHMGGPIGIGPYEGRRKEVFADWRYWMGKLSVYGNIVVKLGGLGMLMSGFDFHERALPPTSDDLAQGWGPYVQECITLFGPERCMFESNFPVDKGTSAYVVLWNAFKKSVHECTEDEKHELFFGTSNRIYGLGLDECTDKTDIQRDTLDREAR